MTDDTPPLSATDTLKIPSALQSVTREQLYEMVWREPMLRVAKYFSVSSSYMARVCTELRVPRPHRGHWAKLEFGKPSPQQSLPDALPGHMTIWNRVQILSIPQPMIVPSPESRTRVVRRLQRPQPGAIHELVLGAKPHFIKGQISDIGLLRPSKRLLVDIVVSKTLLDQALETANALFQTLSARGHCVVLAPLHGQMRRAEIDEREVPKKNHYHQAVWSPNRPTVAYIAGVPIGITLLEMTEEIEVIYVNGDYLPIRTLTPAQVQRFKGPQYWNTTKSFASGRLCLQAYSPNWRVSWSNQWRETKPGQLSNLVKRIVCELETVASVLTRQIEEAELRAEAQRREWEAERERQRIEAELARRTKARADARHDLLSAISAWDEVRRIHAYFASAELEVQRLEEAERLPLLERINEAREMIGSMNALNFLKKWKPP